MMLTTAVRKKTTRDWQDKLPQLGTVRPMLLGRVVGPFLQGILLDRRSDGKTYFPTLFVCSLTSSSTVFSMTVAQKLLTARTHAEDYISVVSHDTRYVDAIDRLITETLLPLDGNWILRDVIATLLGYRQNDGGLGPNPELMLELIGACVWSGAHDAAREIATGLVNLVRGWPPFVRENHGDEAEWRDKADKVLGSAGSIHEYVASQVVAWGLERLPVSRLLTG